MPINAFSRDRNLGAKQRAQGDAFHVETPQRYRRITRSSSPISCASRKRRNSSASPSVVTVAANRTRTPPGERARPPAGRAPGARPRWRSWRSGVGLSRLTCSVTRSLGRERSISSRRPPNSIPLVSTVVGAATSTKPRYRRYPPAEKVHHQSRRFRRRQYRPPREQSAEHEQGQAAAAARWVTNARNDSRNAGCSRNSYRAKGGNRTDGQRRC